MNKKKKSNSQSQQPLSPESYIRQRGKTLPVYKCYVTSNWKEVKLCNVFVTRKHVTGNVTFCGYLVDLSCLGVKDTVYKFNVPLEEFEDIMEKYKTQIDFIEISYELAHNIIYAGLEYAEDLGFQPHKDFLSITSYFLEEDTDDIPIIEIECGFMDGKPMYANTGFDSNQKTKKIMEQLEKSRGSGNFDYIIGHDLGKEDDDYNDYDDFDDDDFEDENYDFEDEDDEENN